MTTHSKVRYHDISPEISSELAVWPGDQNFSRKPSVEFEKGGNLCLSSIQTTLHLGAHTDAPNHYNPHGLGIDKRKLDFYFGKCQVIQVSLSKNERIYPLHFVHSKIVAPRVLFKTSSFPDPNQWNSDFNSLSPETVDFLASYKVVLIGIDTPSIDPFADRELLSHQAIYKNDMAILEGIVLTQVPEGVYDLFALPLKIRDADASPVRAILVEDKLK